MIGVFKKKDSLPEYLSHYGMHRAPFSSDMEDDMFYADPIREQRLNVLFHLTQNTNELLVLIGEQGMGKTTFIDQFRKNAAEHWRMCFIEGHKTVTEEQFLQLIYKGFNIAHSSAHKGTMQSNLRKRLETMLEEAIPVILVIDDAHLFSTNVLTLIIDIASIKNTKTGGSVRVILAAEPQIKIILAEPELDNTHNLIIRKIDLPPLDESHTGNYLHHRLTQAGMQAEQFLTKATIHKIFKSSGGIPKKINEAADKLLFDTTPIIRRHSHIQSAQQSSGVKRLVMALLLVVIIVVVFIVFKTFQQKPVNNEISTKSEKTTTPLILPPVNQFKAIENEAKGIETSDELTDPMQSLKEELADSPAEPEVNPEENMPVANKPTPPAPPETDQQNNSGSPEKQEIQSVSEQSSKTDNPGSENLDVKDNNWVMEQEPSLYTLQLVTGRQKQTIGNFIKKYNLSNNLVYFSSKRNQKIWHNLSFGIYPDRKSANQAINELPDSLKEVKPWIRKLEIIQAEIRQLDQQ